MEDKTVSGTKKIANNTVEYHRANGERVVRLHDTDILTFEPNGAVTLNTDGWKTVTTKDCMNRFLPDGYTLYSERGVWMLYAGTGYARDKKSTGKRVVYADGMRIGPRGGITGAGNRKNDDKLKGLIKRYCTKVKSLALLPMPNGGDCWLCAFVGVDNGKPWDEGDKEHFIGHLKEQYVHGSLIVNALKWAGHDINTSRMYSLVFNRDEKLSRNYRDYAVRAVCRYLKRQCGLA